MKLHPTPFVILSVEDNPGDVWLIREAFNGITIDADLHFASDGRKAMAFLRREEEYADAPRPDLILLDLNLPRKSGQEVLSEIKDDPSLRSIPTIVLTCSALRPEIVSSYLRHANCFITKPMDLNGFTKVLKSLDEFWLSVATLPGEVSA